MSYTSQQVLKYIKKIHKKGFSLDHTVQNYAEWELDNIPVADLQIASDNDPYNRILDLNQDHVDSITKQDILAHAIVVDENGHIIDGNHRAAKAQALGMKVIPAFVPVVDPDHETYDQFMKRTQANEVTIDNKEGAGAVPYNQDVDYFGLRVKMKPSVFLRLAAPLGREHSAELEQYIKDGGAIGAPFLDLVIPKEWDDGDFSMPAKVQGHEGRNRMTAIQKIEGDAPIEVHLFPKGGYRARDLTPDYINGFNKGLFAEKSTSIVRGPLFDYNVSESMFTPYELAIMEGGHAIEESADHKAWIEKMYSKYQAWPMDHNQRVMVWGTGEEQQFAVFELKPSMSKRGAVEVAWFQAYPLRQGVGSRAMKELQAQAQADGISLTLYPWDKGRVSQAKLIKFYKQAGFKPAVKGAKNMAWSPEQLDEISDERLQQYLSRANRQIDTRLERMARVRDRLNKGYEIYHAETPNRIVHRFDANTPAEAQRYYADYINNYESDRDYDLRLRRATGIMEAFDQPYPLHWENSDYGDVDALAKLPDGSPLSIMFNKQQDNDGDEIVQVEFYRNNSQEVTSEGDAMRIFATVLSAIQQYIKEHQPKRLAFSASKDNWAKQQQNSESRAKLYDRLVQRYSNAWGYRAFRADSGDLVIYELSRLKQRVAEGGWASTATQNTVITPRTVVEIMEALKTFESSFNTWQAKQELDVEIKIGGPKGSGTYYRRDLEQDPEREYGDVDVECFIHSREGVSSAQRITEYRTAITEYCLQSPDYSTENGTNIIMKTSSGAVQVDMLYTFHEHANWSRALSPEYRVKGVISTSLTSSLAEVLNLSFSSQGIQVKIRNNQPVSFRQSKDVELRTVSTTPETWAQDIYSLYYYLANGEKPSEFPGGLKAHGGLKDEQRLSDIVLSIKSLANAMEESGLLGHGSLISIHDKKDMIRKVASVYSKKLETAENSSKFDKAQTPAAVEKAKKTKLMLAKYRNEITKLLLN